MQRRRALAGVAALAGAASMPRAQAPAAATVVTPREFGALGNGQGDDTRALQRALDHAREIGGELHLTPGVYPISEYLIVRHGVRAVLGRGGVIRCMGGGQDAGLLLAGIALGEHDNVRGLRIEGLVIDAARRERPVNAIHGQNCRDCRFVGNRIVNLRAGSGILVHSLAEGREAASDNLIADNTIEGDLGEASSLWWGIRVNAPPRFEAGEGPQDRQWKAHFVAADAALPIARHIVRGNRVQGGYYGIWLMAARDCLVQDNHLHGQVRSISVQDCSQGNRIARNQCLESLSSAIHLAYGARDNEVAGNRIHTGRGDGEGLLQAYVGVRDNRFADNEVVSLGRSRYLVYCGIHADRNEFRGNRLHGRALRAGIALESNWNGWSLDAAHYGHLKGPLVNGFAREASTANRLIGNELVAEGDAPALWLAQIGDARTPLADCVVEGNRLLAGTPRRCLQLLESSAGQLRGLRFIGNRFPPDARAGDFQLPRGLAHFSEAYDNDAFDRLVGTRRR